MRILLLSTYFLPDYNSSGVLMAQIFEELHQMGHQITVITSVPHYDHYRVWDEYRGKLVWRETYRGMDVRRTYVYTSNSKKSLGGRTLNYLSFHAISAPIGLASGRHDLIMCLSPPLTNGMVAYLISRVKGIPFVYTVHDIYPEVVVKLGTLRNRRVIAFFEWMERFVYAKAVHLTVISEGFRRNLLAKGVPDHKLTVIPNFADTGFIRPLPKSNSFSQPHGLEDRFVVMHAGNVGWSQGLETLLQCARLLASQKDILFLIVGNGATKPSLVRMAQEMGLENVRFLPYQPREDLPYMRAAADVQVSLLKRGITTTSVPCKVYEIMASARPVLAGVDLGSDTWQLVEGARCGLCVEPENPQQLAAAVLQLYQDRDLREELGRNGREHVEAHYSCQAVARRYHELFQRLVAG